MTRTIEQNKLLWALLNDVAAQVRWPVNGAEVLMDAHDWKNVFTAALVKHQRIAQGIEGGWVLLGTRTSRMSVSEMMELIELIQAFGAQHGVEFSDPAERAAMAAYEGVNGTDEDNEARDAAVVGGERNRRTERDAR
jgi:hypothetical protein